MVTTNDLLQKKSRHQASGLNDAEIARHLAAVDGWTLEGKKIVKTFSFKNYYETLAFVNAIAWIIHAEDHHPELTVTYSRCTVKFDTHSTGGLSENDFICAAKTDAIHRQLHS